MESIHCNSLLNPNFSLNQRRRRINHAVLNRRDALLRSLNAVELRRSRTFSAVRTSNFSVTAAATDVGGRNSTDASVMTTAMSGVERGVRVGKSSSALEQLDIERGVCVPFRKYSPETV
jgi:hypothetical protein